MNYEYGVEYQCTPRRDVGTLRKNNDRYNIINMCDVQSNVCIILL